MSQTTTADPVLPEPPHPTAQDSSLESVIAANGRLAAKLSELAREAWRLQARLIASRSPAMIATLEEKRGLK